MRSLVLTVTTTLSSNSWVTAGSSSLARPLTEPTIFTPSEPASHVISSTHVGSMPWRWRRIGPTPTGLIATSWDSQETRTPTRRSRTSSGSRLGCGGTTKSSPSWNGCAPATTHRPTQQSRRDLRLGPLQPPGLDRGCCRISRPCRSGRSRTSTGPFFMLRSCGWRRPGIWLCPCLFRRDPMRERGRHPAHGAPTKSGGIPSARRLGGRRRVLLRRAERTCGARCRGVLPADVSGGRVLVEPP